MFLLSAVGDTALNTLGNQDRPRLIANLAVQAESITTLHVLLVDMFLHQKRINRLCTVDDS